MRIFLGGYLPFYAAGQTWLEVAVAAPASLSEILSRLHLPAGEVFITAVNGVLVDINEVQVSQSDEVRLYPPAHGG